MRVCDAHRVEMGGRVYTCMREYVCVWWARGNDGRRFEARYLLHDVA